MARKFQQLGIADRKKVEEAYRSGTSAADIAEVVGIALSSVYRELKRGYTGANDENGRPAYSADAAQRTVSENTSRRGRRFLR